jgi:hypothetical protein
VFFIPSSCKNGCGSDGSSNLRKKRDFSIKDMLKIE